jgi:hypothetical protein
MACCDLPVAAWTIIQPLLSAESVSPRIGRPWAEHRMIINGMFWVLCSGAHGAIYLNDIVHGRSFKTVLTGGQNREILTLFSTG